MNKHAWSKTAALAGAGLAACAMTGTMAGAAHAAPAPATSAHTTTSTVRSTRLTTSSLLSIESARAAGLAADSAQVNITGMDPLGDAGRYDEGCLWEKSMRNITSSKDYPAPGEAKAYAAVTLSSTVHKNVWALESATQATTKADADRYVRVLTSEIRDVTSCEEDPAQGNYYGPAHTVHVGSATVTYYVDYLHTGKASGGGSAIIRSGNKVAFLDLLNGGSHPAQGLRKLSVAAAHQLG